jgi:hypothetical protein
VRHGFSHSYLACSRSRVSVMYSASTSRCTSRHERDSPVTSYAEPFARQSIMRYSQISSLNSIGRARKLVGWTSLIVLLLQLTGSGLGATVFVLDE